MQLHDIERLLAEQGYRLERIRGSHRHYRHERTRQRLTLNAHGGKHCQFNWRRLAQLRKDLARCTRAAVASEASRTRDLESHSP